MGVRCRAAFFIPWLDTTFEFNLVRPGDMRDISRGRGCYYCRWKNDERVNHNNDDDDDGRQRRRRTSLVWCNLSNRYINALLESDNFVSVRAGWRDRSEACVPRGNDYLHHNWPNQIRKSEFHDSLSPSKPTNGGTFGTIII